MFTTNKALIAGGGVTIASPIGNAISWGLQQIGMPPDVANGFAAVLAGILVGLLAYYIPNKEPAA